MLLSVWCWLRVEMMETNDSGVVVSDAEGNTADGLVAGPWFRFAFLPLLRNGILSRVVLPSIM